MTGERFQLSDVQRLDLPRGDQAHLWYCRLNECADYVERFQVHLSAGELERASRFVSEPVRNRFVVGRGVLRSLLGGYLAKPASKIELTLDLLGKPRIESTPLQFNLAHSGEWLLIAIASESEVGIDIERHQAVKNWRGIAESHFSAAERFALPSEDSERPPELFFQIWTRKEAILKWLGTGLQTPLSSFDVPTSEQCRDRVELPTVAKRCWVTSLTAPTGYSAALATTQPRADIVLREIVLS